MRVFENCEEGIKLYTNQCNGNEAMIKSIYYNQKYLIETLENLGIKTKKTPIGIIPESNREEEIYKKIENFAKEKGVSENLVKQIYKLIIANALEIEEKISEEPNTAIMNREIDVTQIEEIKKKFEKLDTILTQEIPNTIAEISNSSELKDLSLTDKATLYYNEKINK